MSPILLMGELIDRLTTMISYLGAGHLRDRLEQTRAKADSSSPKTLPRWRDDVSNILAETELRHGVPPEVWECWQASWPEPDPPPQTLDE